MRPAQSECGTWRGCGPQDFWGNPSLCTHAHTSRTPRESPISVCTYMHTSKLRTPGTHESAHMHTHTQGRTRNTFHNSLQLLKVAVLLAVVDNSLHREDEFRLNLRKPVQDTLKMRGRVIRDYTCRTEDAIVNAEHCRLSPTPAANTGSAYKLQPHLGSGGHSKEGCRFKRTS